MLPSCRGLVSDWIDVSDWIKRRMHQIPSQMNSGRVAAASRIESYRARLRVLAVLAAIACAHVFAGSPLAHAQAAPEPEQGAGGETKGRQYRTIIRFVTDSDYPPFNYLDDEGTLTGFNVDVARAICLELDVSCDVQSRDWKDLVPALKRGDTDAVIASLSITPRALSEVDFTDRYFFSPARFVTRKNTFPSLKRRPSAWKPSALAFSTVACTKPI